MPGRGQPRASNAEDVFRATYPSLYTRMKPLSDCPHQAPGQGPALVGTAILCLLARIREPKIVYQEIQFHPCYALDPVAAMATTRRSSFPLTTYICWASSTRRCCGGTTGGILPHMKDEALSPVAFLMETLPDRLADR